MKVRGRGVCKKLMRIKEKSGAKEAAVLINFCGRFSGVDRVTRARVDTAILTHGDNNGVHC
jgi:hypothetical protein